MIISNVVIEVGEATSSVLVIGLTPADAENLEGGLTSRATLESGVPAGSQVLVVWGSSDEALRGSVETAVQNAMNATVAT